MMPQNLYQKGLAFLDETILKLVEIKSAYISLLNLHQQTIRIFTALVALNNPDVDKILGEAQITITDEHGRQVFPRGGSAPSSPTVIYSGTN